MSKLTHSQKKKFVKVYHEGGEQYRIEVEVRFDDECNNGHNTFAMTAGIHRKAKNGRWAWCSGGCQHEEIAKHFPNLAKYIKWHLSSTDGPMHYLANTIYLAGDRDHNGRTKGERYHVNGCEEKRVVFGDFPITFEFKRGMTKFIESVPDWTAVEPVEVPHEKEPKTYGSKWSLTGHICQWYECPFDRKEEAEEFIEACRRFAPQIRVYQEKFTRVGEGKERQLDAARSAACWPDATEEELTAPGLKERLVARLEALTAAFRSDMEELGFVW